MGVDGQFDVATNTFHREDGRRLSGLHVVRLEKPSLPLGDRRLQERFAREGLVVGLWCVGRALFACSASSRTIRFRSTAITRQERRGREKYQNDPLWAWFQVAKIR